ncbi:MAG TPA: hypothetical protein VI300_09275 [Solirubrobacter sp.]
MDWSLSDDGQSLYGLQEDGRGIAILRQSGDHGFRQLPGRRGCVNTNGSDGCQRSAALVPAQPYAGLWLFTEEHEAFLVEDDVPRIRIVAFARDRSSGALRVPVRSRCVASTPTPACRRLIGLAAYTTVFDIQQTADGRDVYVATREAIIHLRRRPDGGLQPIRGMAGCSGRSRVCRRTAIPAHTEFAQLQLSDDDRNVYATYSGHVALGGNGNVYPGAILAFSRDPRSGSLALLAGGCLSEIHLVPSCSALSVVHPDIEDLTFASARVGYAFSQNMQDGHAALVQIQRDPLTGAIAPADTPSACWGAPDDEDGVEPLEQSRRGEPCTAIAEWKDRGLSAAPLLSADGRNVYVLSESSDNFADLPTSYRYSSIIEFARDPASGRLTRLSGSRDCLGALRVTSCRRLFGEYYSNAVAEAAGGRVLVLAVSAPRRGSRPAMTLHLLARDVSTGGSLTPIRGRGGCIAATPTRACLRLRGLTAKGDLGSREPELETDASGKYLYVLRENVAVLRIRHG